MWCKEQKDGEGKNPILGNINSVTCNYCATLTSTRHIEGFIKPKLGPHLQQPLTITYHILSRKVPNLLVIPTRKCLFQPHTPARSPQTPTSTQILLLKHQSLPHHLHLTARTQPYRRRLQQRRQQIVFTRRGSRMNTPRERGALRQ